MNGLQFSSRQQTTIAAAITLVCAAVIVASLTFFFVLLGQFLSFFSGVFLPLAVAGILALMLRPYYDALLKRLRSPVLAAILVLVSFLLPLVLLLWFFGAMVVEQTTHLVQQIPDWWSQMNNAVQRRMPELQQYWDKQGLSDRLQVFLSRYGDRVAGAMSSVGNGVIAAGAGVFRTIAGWLNWLVVPVYLLFFLTGSPFRTAGMDDIFPFLKPETRRNVIYLVTEFLKILVAFFRGQVLVALAQGVLYALGFVLVGLQFGVVIGLLLGLLNVIPYLGAIIGLLIALPTAFFQDGGGNVTLVLSVLVIVVVQMIEAFILTPRIVGTKTGLHPMIIIVAMFFWGTALGGVLGMILAVPLTAFLVVFWRLLKTKYIKEIV
jgi:predicted PurR-regulated permease PerM